MERIGLLGGSFNPIHIGHLHLAESARHELNLDRVLFIPTGINPFKGKNNEITSQNRLAMIQLAIKSNPKFEISDIEITREGKSYTIDTIHSLKKIYPDAEFFFITGADIMFEITRWKNAEDLFNMVIFVTCCRPGYSQKKLNARIDFLTYNFNARIVKLFAPEMEIASSTIRNNLKKNNSIKYLVPDEVESYIFKHQLYQQNFFLDEVEIKRKLRELLKPSRYEHTLNVVNAAIELAQQYGCDLEKTKIAALLHDCAKNFTDDQLMEIALNAGFDVDFIMHHEPQLLHGPVGALVAQNEFGIFDQSILDAICYHTTGREKMTKLEKIIYLADYIEPGRSFPGVETLRKIAKESLDEAMIFALSNTISYIALSGGLIHPLTIETRNQLLLKK